MVPWESGDALTAAEDNVGGLRESLLSALYPRRCPVCDGIPAPRGRRICPDCARKLQFVTEPVCKCCGREIREQEGELCQNCLKHHFSFDYGIALMNYTDEAARSMAAVKYKGRREYLEYYGLEAVKRCGDRLRRMQVDALVPVPVHPDRLRQRGYNQAEVLAEEISKGLGIPVYEPLYRARNTKALKELNASQRRRNLQEAFRSEPLPPDVRRVCIVDDIFTTGATMEACTRALLAAGAQKVFSFCLCMRSEN